MIRTINRTVECKAEHESLKVLGQAFVITSICVLSIATGTAILIKILGKLSTVCGFGGMITSVFIGLGLVFTITSVIAFALAYMMGVERKEN